MLDLIIRNGTLVDGTGERSRGADVAIARGKIVQVGEVEAGAAAKKEIDATGKIVTPGFIDPHTHYDGQITWDPLLTPSTSHGVTTAVFGNCGVGFAPVRAEDREFLIDLMEGVEDIPGTALSDGIKWNWESFPEYLDSLRAQSRTIDLVAQLPHAPLRLYAMGREKSIRAPATQEALSFMANATTQAIKAGTRALSTGRITLHRAASSGEHVPGTFADENELRVLIEAMQAGGGNLLQVVPEGLNGETPGGYDKEVLLYGKLSRETGCRIFALITQNGADPEGWKRILASVEDENARGAKITVSASVRPLGVMMSWDAFNPYSSRPSYSAIAELPLHERLRKLRDPSVRSSILSEKTRNPKDAAGLMMLKQSMDRIFPLGDKPFLEPDPSTSIAAQLAAKGGTPEELIYDAMCDAAEQAAGRGPGFLEVCMSGYAYGDLSAIEEMINHPDTVIGGGDAGAHVAAICSYSYPTYLLQHWTRDRTRGPRMKLEMAVKKLTADPARLYELDDRGVVSEGKRADLNIIDYEGLQLGVTTKVNDLPTGAARLSQSAEGYLATIKNGEIIMAKGADTGARPGKLVEWDTSG